MSTPTYERPRRGRNDGRIRTQRSGRAAAGDGGARHDGAAAAGVPSGRALHLQHLSVAHDFAGRDLRAPRARIRDLSDGAAGRDAAASRAQRRLDAHRADQGSHRRARGGPRHRCLRTVRRRRQLRRRHGGVHGAGDHQLRRDHQGRRAHLRSQRALHPGCDARPADGDRCRPECRHHHAGRGDRAPPRGARGGGFLRRDGRCEQVRARRCDRRHPGRLHQPVRRHHHRRRAARHVAGGRRPHLRAADHRRRPGGADSRRCCSPWRSRFW